MDYSCELYENSGQVFRGREIKRIVSTYWGVKNLSHFVSTWVTQLKAKNDEKGLLIVITSSLAQKMGKKQE